MGLGAEVRLGDEVGRGDGMGVGTGVDALGGGGWRLAAYELTASAPDVASSTARAPTTVSLRLRRFPCLGFMVHSSRFGLRAPEGAVRTGVSSRRGRAGQRARTGRSRT
ncbi:hypothetical protein Xph01_38160 [Micromonospora phaseoli]|nr:hypothetical protein Xph01_38160 [Micromonospora phaseoli]